MSSSALERPRVAFVCTHNACRSQMAEAIARAVTPDAMEPRSAGTHPASAVNPDALRTLAERYETDPATLLPKALDELGAVDVVVTMDCGMQCPALPCAHREDWGLEDPTGRGDAAFAETARVIEEKVRDLARRIERGQVEGVRAPLRAGALRALADERRLAVLAALSDADELCACELLDGLGIGQPTLSHHMGVLVGSGLVTARREGRWLHYRLDRERLSALGAALGELGR